MIRFLKFILFFNTNIVFILCDDKPEFRYQLSSADLQKYLFWPNGTVPFFINPNHYDYEQMMSIMRGLKKFALKTCLQFAPTMLAPVENQHVLVFENPEGHRRCNIVTRGHSIYEPHYVTLGYDCLQSPQIEMFIMKALGFPFEHNRASRDVYIQVLLENIEPGSIELFTKESAVLPTELRALKYDVDSVMHFAERDYTKNGHRTFMFRIRDTKQRRVGLSPTDLRKIELVYTPECQKRDRSEKVEICQSYPSVRRKRELTPELKSLRVNPDITPPPETNNITIDEDLSLTPEAKDYIKGLGIEEEIQIIVEHAYRVSALALKNARLTHCDANNTNTTEDASNATDISRVIEVITDYAKSVVHNAISNLTVFCEEPEDFGKYQRQRGGCGYGDNSNRCRQTYRSTKSGPVQHSTQHRPTYIPSTKHYGIGGAYLGHRRMDDNNTDTTTEAVRNRRHLLNDGPPSDEDVEINRATLGGTVDINDYIVTHNVKWDDSGEATDCANGKGDSDKDNNTNGIEESKTVGVVWTNTTKMSDFNSEDKKPETVTLNSNITTQDVVETTAASLNTVVAENSSASINTVVAENSSASLNTVVAENSSASLNTVVAENSSASLNTVVAETTTASLNTTVAETIPTGINTVAAETTTANLNTVVSETATSSINTVAAGTTTASLNTVVSETATTGINTVAAETTTASLNTVVSETATSSINTVAAETTTASLNNVVSETPKEQSRRKRDVNSEDNKPVIVASNSNLTMQGLVETTTVRLNTVAAETTTASLNTVVSETATTNINTVAAETTTASLSTVVSETATTNINTVAAETTTASLNNVVSETPKEQSRRKRDVNDDKKPEIVILNSNLTVQGLVETTTASLNTIVAETATASLNNVVSETATSSINTVAAETTTASLNNVVSETPKEQRRRKRDVNDDKKPEIVILNSNLTVQGLVETTTASLNTIVAETATASLNNVVSETPKEQNRTRRDVNPGDKKPELVVLNSNITIPVVAETTAASIVAVVTETLKEQNKTRRDDNNEDKKEIVVSNSNLTVQDNVEATTATLNTDVSETATASLNTDVSETATTSLNTVASETATSSNNVVSETPTEPSRTKRDVNTDDKKPETVILNTDTTERERSEVKETNSSKEVEGMTTKKGFMKVKFEEQRFFHGRRFRVQNPKGKNAKVEWDASAVSMEKTQRKKRPGPENRQEQEIKQKEQENAKKKEERLEMKDKQRTERKRKVRNMTPKTVTLTKLNAEFYNERKWPGGDVRFIIAENPLYDLNDVRRRLNAVNSVLKRRTCVQLRELTDDEANNYEDFLVIDTSPDYVTGRVGGRQNFGSVELFRGGQHRQHAAMMVMAMLGFYFEVARHDRDKYIRVHMRHVRPDKLHHFEKIREEATLSIPYDYLSATHPAWQFWRKIGKTGISTVATYKEHDPDGSVMKRLGQSEDLLSELDIVKINSVYGVKCFQTVRTKRKKVEKKAEINE